MEHAHHVPHRIVSHDTAKVALQQLRLRSEDEIRRVPRGVDGIVPWRVIEDFRHGVPGAVYIVTVFRFRRVSEEADCGNDAGNCGGGDYPEGRLFVGQDALYPLLYPHFPKGQGTA